MEIGHIRRSEVLSRLEQGGLLLTASSELASQWRQRFVLAASSVCETPHIYSWGGWLQQLAAGCDAVPLPLTAIQEQQLWERVIREDATSRRTASAARGLARHASTAYRMLCHFRIDTGQLAGADEEADALARWIAAMQQALKKLGRVLLADLPERLLSQPSQQLHSEQIMLDGFASFTPVQQALLDVMQENGAYIDIVGTSEEIEVPEIEAELSLGACPDSESEYRHVTKQISSYLQANAGERIAVVLSAQANDIEILRRILNETLLAQTLAAASSQAVVMPGAPLSAKPMIHQLLAFLQLAGQPGAAFADFSPLLFSPGLRGYAEEREGRALLDAKLREDNRHYLTFRTLLSMQETENMPQLRGVIAALADWKTQPRRAGEWVKAVHLLLQETGFLQADSENRSGGEIRQLNAFRDCLASLVAVEVVNESMEWRNFLSLLAMACKETQLAESASFPNVYVLPLERIAGLKFDRVFAVGFDEEALPFPAQPIALLPLSLQRSHGLPGTTAALAYAESLFLWQQLRQASPHLHVSFAESRDGQELNASPMLAGVPILPFSTVEILAERLESEDFEDAPSVPLSMGEPARGGAAIVRNQSACPFRAFATHRLLLAPLGETAPGIEAADKGSLIHHALQFIWEKLELQQALLALDDAQASSLVHEAVEFAWREVRIATPDSAREFERRRMVAVLLAWLQEERGRPPFTVVQCEKEYRLQLPEHGEVRFPVRLKADRIDRDGDGHKILIDYKTGQKQSASKWIGERIPEPQLPLYAMAENLGEQDAVCFARVRSGDMGFEGLCGDPVGLKGVGVYKGNDPAAEKWTDLLERWKERIDRLAVEFVEGRCDVSPRDVHACDYCGLEAVCRIGELGLVDTGEDEA